MWRRRWWQCDGNSITLQDLGITDRCIWLFDTFEGMPEPTQHDKGRFDTPAIKLYNKKFNPVYGWIKFGVDDVLANVLTTGYSEQNFEFANFLGVLNIATLVFLWFPRIC